MQYKTYFKYLNLILFTLILFNNNSNSIENKIILKIENQIITTLDIENEKNYLKALNPSIRNMDKDKIIIIAKNSLIREKVKENEILKYTDKITLDEKFLNKLIVDRYSKLNLNNKNEFLNHLKNYKINIKEIEEKISIEALWNQVIYQKFSSKVKINETELEKQIEEAFSKGEKSYLLSEIVLEPLSENELKKKYDLIKKEIFKNNFQSAALIYSISDSAQLGGEIGWIKENSINKKINKILKNLSKKEFSKPIFTSNGYLILKIDDIKFTKIKFDKKKELDNLIKIKTNQQLNQYSNNYYKKVKKNTIIHEL